MLEKSVLQLRGENESEEGNEKHEDEISERVDESNEKKDKQRERGRVLSKLRSLGRRTKIRIRREQSTSSHSTYTDHEVEGAFDDEDEEGQGVKTDPVESEFTETPMQTNETHSSDELVSFLYCSLHELYKKISLPHSRNFVWLTSRFETRKLFVEILDLCIIIISGCC